MTESVQTIPSRVEVRTAGDQVQLVIVFDTGMEFAVSFTPDQARNILTGLEIAIADAETVVSRGTN